MKEAPSAATGPAGAPDRPDVWPHTTRPLPWLLAGFVTMLFLVPINGVELDIPSPVDPHLDRYVLACVIAIWILVTWLRRTPTVQVERPGLFLWAGVAFTAIALLGVVMNMTDIAGHDLLGLAQNRLALLLSFVIFAWFTVAAMRPAELSNFSLLLVVLATITAVGVIWERRTGFNMFYDLIGRIFDPIARVAEAPTEINPDPTKEARKVIVGPTDHGLAVATMMIMALPFAVVRFTQTRGNGRWLYAIAVALIMAAALSTERKTAVLTPIAALVVIAAYRPRVALRMLPLALLMVVFIHAAAPGALGTISELSGTFTSDSSAGRSDDYSASFPDIFAHPLLGSGYGTRDIEDINNVRILDNEYLGQLLTVGLIGMSAFIVLIISAMVVPHRTIRTGDPARAGPALAASAASVVFLVAAFLFDIMSFSQAPYVFFFVGGMATVAASRELPAACRRPCRDARAASTAATGGAGVTDRPDLSVIVVTYNGREMALATLRSALASAGDATIEWLVVDSGSSDGTPDAIASEFPEVQVFRRSNRGFAAGNNVALEGAAGRYVLLLNPDVEIRSGNFDDLVAAMDARPDVGMASVVQRGTAGELQPSIRRFPSPLRSLGESLFAAHWPLLRTLQELETRADRYVDERHADWLVGAFLIARREAVEDVGPMDERFFLYSEEIDWCFRFWQAGWRVAHLPVMVVTHHAGKRSRGDLISQLSHSRLLFAGKHFGRLRAAGIRVALGLGHAIRLAVFGPPSLLRPVLRERVRGERAGLAVVLGLSGPPLGPARRSRGVAP
jgi:GT2 family glycosyltransferase